MVTTILFLHSNIFLFSFIVYIYFYKHLSYTLEINEVYGLRKLLSQMALKS